MLELTVPGYEYFDDRTNRFGYTQTTVLQLEHSLESLARWEEKWHIPFLGKDEKTMEQCIDYVRCMTLTPNVDPLVYKGLTNDNFEVINRYIDDPMTATTFREDRTKRPSRQEIVTAEVIYYWMVSLEIPFECAKWHLNKLITLVRVCEAKNAPAGKKGRTPKQDMLSQRAALNQARRARLHSKG